MASVPALVVHQWLSDWDDVNFNPAPPRGKPEPHFYLFSINAYQLKRLSGIYRRDPNLPPADDLGIQRRHLPERSKEILRYIQDGFPLSRINRRKLVNQDEVPSLRMPGWLSTSIIANILTDTDTRGPKKAKVPPSDLVTIEEPKNGITQINFPPHCFAPGWRAKVHPIEIIDGQHRLWAMEEPVEEQNSLWTDDLRQKLKQLELPVVAFHGLDRTWQAYLFYTINQLPKPVDRSLVYDLYPLLREQTWLERIEGPEIYRESRSQDLTMLLWSHAQSPWKNRILRHGGRSVGMVTQASFIRSLTASFLKSFNPSRGIGGLFGAPHGTHDLALAWSREQQAALLIVLWRSLRDTLSSSTEPWIKELEGGAKQAGGKNFVPSFEGPHTLLATDQGVRTIHWIANALFRQCYEDEAIRFNDFIWNRAPQQNDDDAINDALITLDAAVPEVVKLCREFADCAALFDWRTSGVLPRTHHLFDRQSSFRGSAGYATLRHYLLEHLASTSTPGLVAKFAKECLRKEQSIEQEDA